MNCRTERKAGGIGNQEGGSRGKPEARKRQAEEAGYREGAGQNAGILRRAQNDVIAGGVALRPGGHEERTADLKPGGSRYPLIISTSTRIKSRKAMLR
jgi:hypothetical protein